MDTSKWSRNLSFENTANMNRIRMMAKQKLEMKRSKQQQMIITPTRPQSSRPIKSAFLRGNLDNKEDDDSEDSQKIEKVLSTSESEDMSPYRAELNSGFDSPIDLLASPYKSAQKITERSQNISALAQTNESKISQSKSVSNLSELNGSDPALHKERSLSITKLNNSVSSSLNPLLSILNNKELLQFTTLPVPKGKIYQCTIIRDKKGIDRSFYPTYYMHLQAITDSKEAPLVEGFTAVEEDSSDLSDESKVSANSSERPSTTKNTTNPINAHNRQVFLLSGRRRKKSKTYLIACDPFDITRSNCIAKLKSNVIGTQFNTVRITSTQQRMDHCTIIYETNVLGFKGPRKMTILMPKLEDFSIFNQMNSNNNFNLHDMWKANQKSVIELRNKTPVWNEETQSYVLNFRGRVTQASVKNFQLLWCKDHKKSDNVPFPSVQAADLVNNALDSISSQSNTHSSTLASNTSSNNPDTPTSSSSRTSSGTNLALDEDIAMQFGRVSEKEFTCDVTWPMSLLQAFSIALSSFDSKLACE